MNKKYVKPNKMTDEIDVLRKTISEYEDAKRIKNMNEELLHHLSGSIFYLLKHTEKYSIPLPRKDELVRMLEKANFLIDEIIYQPTLNTSKNNREDNRTYQQKTLNSIVP